MPSRSASRDRKRGITIRHLLTHTSGRQDEPRELLEIEPSGDLEQLPTSHKDMLALLDR